MPKKITHVTPEYLKVPVGLEFSGKFPRAFGASPYRAALEDLAEGKAEAARFNDATHVRTALKKWAEKLKISAEYAKQGNFLWVRVDARRRAPVAEKNDLAAAIMKAVGEVPRTTAEIVDRVTKFLFTEATVEQVRTEVRRLFAAGTIRKTEDDLKYTTAGKQRG